MTRRARSRFDASAERLGPAYLIAVGVHVVGLLALSVWTVVQVVGAEPAQPIRVRLAPPLRDEVAAAPPVDRLQAAVEPAPPEGAVAADTDAAFDEAAGRGTGVAREGTSLAVGLGGGGGRGRGGYGGSIGGPSLLSEGALASGLAWLARHRAGDGGWGPVGEDHGKALPAAGDPARTGLALLAFLMAGHEPGKPGPFQAEVDGAVAWLARGCGGAQGLAVGDSQAAPYHLAMGTLGLAEAVARRDDPRARAALVRSVEQILAWQQVGLGFRYGPRQGSDTSVTSWMVLALRSAQEAGVAVPAQVWDDARRWLARVSTADGRTGYTSAGDRDLAAMHASGLCLRLILGESPDTPINQAAADLVLAQAEDPLAGAWDAYQLYYAALALYQVGGERWATLNPRLRDGLVALQVKDGCEAGSWAPADPRGWGYDRQLTTAFGTLILETYYRHLVVHEPLPTRLAGPAGERLAAASEALEQGDAAGLATAEAEAEAALVAAEGDPRTMREAGRVLLSAALRRGDTAQVASRLAALDALGGRPDPSLEPVRAAARRWELDARVEAVLAGPPDSARRNALLRELPRCGPEGRVLVAELRLVMTLEHPTTDVAVVLSRHAPRTPPGPGERHALALVVERGERAYAEKGPEGLARGEALRAAIHARDLPGRLGPGEAQVALLALGRLEAARVAALERAGRTPEASAAAAAWRAAHPGAPSTPLDQAERDQLLARVAAGPLPPEALARLEALAAAWAPSAPPAEVGARLRPAAQALLSRGERAPAGRLAGLARRRAGRAGEPLELTMLLIGQAAPASALAEIARLGREEQRCPEVRLARQAALRRLGRAAEAVDDALGLVRGLKEGTPGWWEALEAAGETLCEAGQARTAALLLESAHRRHPELGGPARRERLVPLMHRADALAR